MYMHTYISMYVRMHICVYTCVCIYIYIVCVYYTLLNLIFIMKVIPKCVSTIY